jgi:hypothetical protein
MADFRAVSAVCEAMMGLLRSASTAAGFDHELQFRVLTSRQFKEEPLNAGVSLFLYRVFVNGTHRLPAGRLGPGGSQAAHQLPLDLHFLLSFWGREASLQHRVAGWAMRIIEDHPLLPSGLLNRVAPDVFRPEETVEISPSELSTEDLLRLWENLAQNEYHLSVPYQARAVWLEQVEPAAGEGEAGEEAGGRPLVQERRFRHGVLEGA